MAHIGNAPFGKTVRTVTSETLTSVKTAYYPTGGYIVGYVDVYVNGVRLTEAADFTATDGTTVTLQYNPSIGDTVDVVTYGSIELANAVRRDGDTLVGTLFTRALVPTANVTYDIGTSTMRYKDLYLSGNTINLGDVQLTTNGTSFSVSNTTGGTFPSALANTTITGTLFTNGAVTFANSTGNTVNFFANGAQQIRYGLSALSVANVALSTYTGLSVLGDEGAVQIAAFDSGDWASSLILTNSTSANSFNRHWWLHHTPSSITNGTTKRLDFKYAETANTSAIGGDGTGTTALSLMSNGHVGIGTTSPGDKLSVSGNLSVAGNIKVEGAKPTVFFNSTTGDSGGYDMAIKCNVAEGFVIFEPEDAGTTQTEGDGKEWMRIDDDGDQYNFGYLVFDGKTAPGAVVKTTTYQSNTMITTGTSADVTYFTFNVTKKYTNSYLVVYGDIPISGSSNHGIYWFVSYNGTKVFSGVSDGWRMHPTGTSPFGMGDTVPGGISVTSTGAAGVTAGTVTIGFGQASTGGGANRPYHYLNPDTSIDGRNRNGTTFIVHEIYS